MSVRRDKRWGTWFYRKQVRTTDGRQVRIFGVPKTDGLPNTRVGAEEAERRAIGRVLKTGDAKIAPPSTNKEVSTIKDFVPVYLEASRIRNKPSSVEAKEAILRVHLVPRIGALRLDQVTYAVLEDLKVALARAPIVNVEKESKGKTSERTLSPKTINNCLTVLRRMLVVARKRGLIASVPEVEWLKAERPEFDFLDFEEADRLVAAAEDEWRTMVLVAMRTGLRQGELIALRWQDVDLVAGRITVRQNAVRGRIGTPKSGKPREIALGDEVKAELKGHRHLRGPLVFCDTGGAMLTKGACKHPLMRACKRAQLRSIGWHVLRHTFASHLAMRGATIKVIQELLGHSTILMTMRYAHLAPEVARDAVRLLDGGAASARSGREMAESTRNVAK